MMNQMAPSDAPGPGVPTVIIDDDPEEAEEVQADELIIDKAAVPLLEKNLRRIEDSFKVVITLGLVAKEEVEKQWIEIQGQDEDRASAKCYVKALCSPGETFPLTFPEEIHELLSSQAVHSHIEKQSNAVVLFLATGRANIQGTDALAVTLAMSLIEDIIHNFAQETPSSPSTPTTSNTRLDSDLRRLSSQNKELYNEDYDMDELQSLPPAVKRTMLKHYMYDPEPCTSPENDPDVDRDQTVPMRLITKSSQPSSTQPSSSPQPSSSTQPSSSSSSPHPLPSSTGSVVSSSQASQPQASTARQPGEELDRSDSDLSLSLHLGSAGGVTERAPMIDVRSQRPVIDLTNKQTITSPTVDQGAEGGAPDNVAHRYALNKGYTQQEIDSVQKDFGDLLSTSEFLKALLTNRRIEKEKESKKKSNETRGRKDSETMEMQAGASRSESSSPELGAMAGKQPNEVQASNQGPKSKKGKHAKNLNKKEKKKRDRASRFSPVEPSVSGEMNGRDGDNSRSPIRDPYEVILQNSPHANNNKATEYLHILTQDCEQENTNNIDDLRQRSARRQALLRQLFTSDDVESREEEDEEDGKMDWSVARRDGRHTNDPYPAPTELNNNKNKAGPSASMARPPSPPTASGSVAGLGEFARLPSPTNQQTKQYLALQRREQAKRQQAEWEREQVEKERVIREKALQDQARREQTQRERAMLEQAMMAEQPQPMVTYQTNLMAGLGSKNHLRYIVIDGSNVAMAHGNHRAFSCKGIRICIDYFKRRGHTEITAFVPQTRTRAVQAMAIRDKHLLDIMNKEGVLVFTPARRVPGKNIVCYDDKFVLRLTQETDGVMVSNDNYRDLWQEKREWRQLIEKRLLMFSFAGDIFMPPDDPLGRNGPNLDQFLCKNNTLDRFGGNDYGRAHPGGAPLQPHNPRFPELFQPNNRQLHHQPNPPHQKPNVRTPDATQWLKQKVLAVLPDTEEAQIDQLLERYPTETNINLLVNLMLGVD